MKTARTNDDNDRKIRQTLPTAGAPTFPSLPQYLPRPRIDKWKRRTPRQLEPWRWGSLEVNIFGRFHIVSWSLLLFLAVFGFLGLRFWPWGLTDGIQWWDEVWAFSYLINSRILFFLTEVCHVMQASTFITRTYHWWNLYWQRQLVTIVDQCHLVSLSASCDNQGLFFTKSTTQKQQRRNSRRPTKRNRVQLILAQSCSICPAVLKLIKTQTLRQIITNHTTWTVSKQT